MNKTQECVQQIFFLLTDVPIPTQEKTKCKKINKKIDKK